MIKIIAVQFRNNERWFGHRWRYDGSTEVFQTSGQTKEEAEKRLNESIRINLRFSTHFASKEFEITFLPAIEWDPTKEGHLTNLGEDIVYFPLVADS